MKPETIQFAGLPWIIAEAKKVEGQPLKFSLGEKVRKQPVFMRPAIFVGSSVLLGLLFVSGVEYLSFTTGLLVGMTIIQVYFHRFCDPLPPEKSPEQPITALKMLSYSIQANPGKAWRELVLMTLLFFWSLYMLATQGFGLFQHRS